MPPRLAGVLGPVVTNFDPAGALDADAFQTNVRIHLATGLQGIVVAGSTGEAPLLDEDERRRLVDLARVVVPKDRWLIAGTGAESTRQCIQRSKDAAERGADAVLVMAPHYYGAAMTNAALDGHFRRVADQSPIPLILYNIPKYMHFALEAELVAELARHKNIIGMKDSSGDLTLLGGYLSAQSGQFTVLTGHGGSFCQALRMGARGGILAVALFAGELSLAVLTSYARGDVDEAERAQRLLSPLAKEIVAALGVAGVKAALDHAGGGFHGGPVRAPLLPLDDVETKRVADLVSTARQPQAARR
ncbi:MAG: dihydrodipicolinate synthase family protein [Gemmatimonadaceae bacterium]